MMKSTIVVLTLAVAILSGIAATPATQVKAQSTTVSSGGGSFANVDVVQNPELIVITITPAGQQVPDGPVVVPDPDAGDNGTIIAPEGNDSIIVLPPQNEPPLVIDNGNMTTIDNDTIIIAPENETITETPGNVTIIDPEPQAPCECPAAPAANETAPEIPPVTVIPAPGQNITQEVPPEPAPEEPAAPAAGNETTVVAPSPGENVTVTAPAPPAAEGGEAGAPGEPGAAGGDNQTGASGGNETGTAGESGGGLEAAQLPAEPTSTEEPTSLSNFLASLFQLPAAWLE